MPQHSTSHAPHKTSLPHALVDLSSSDAVKLNQDTASRETTANSARESSDQLETRRHHVLKLDGEQKSDNETTLTVLPINVLEIQPAQETLLPELVHPDPTSDESLLSSLQSPIDPLNRYQLSQFSAFSTFERTTSRLKRRRENRSDKVSKRVQRDVTLVEPRSGTEWEVAARTAPKGKRAGLQGVRIKRGEIDELLRIPDDQAHTTRRTESLAPSFGPQHPSSAPTFSTASSTSNDSSTYPSPPIPISSQLHSPNLSCPTPPSTSHTSADELELARRHLIESHLITSHPRLATFHFLHRTHIPGQSSTLVDQSRRAFATRIECPEAFSSLASELSNEIKNATEGKGGIKPVQHDGARGTHQVRQVGVHREMGAKLGYSNAFRKQIGKWTSLFCQRGFSRARSHVARCLQVHYPDLYTHHSLLSSCLRSVGLDFLFGAFASICLNTGNSVACLPHRDEHNLGPGLCGILPFGSFDSSRSGWLVLWEAAVVVEVGPGDVFFFPSAVFTHSNTVIWEGDERNSLAFWCGASLFLWMECGKREFKSLGEQEKKVLLEGNRRAWKEGWERFPTL